jgi:hypothetical protein
MARHVAFGKLKAMSDAGAMARKGAHFRMTDLRHTSAFPRRDAPEVCWKFPYPPIEGAGNAGRSMRPQPGGQKKGHTSSNSHHGHTGITRHSPRNGLRFPSCSPR